MSPPPLDTDFLNTDNFVDSITAEVEDKLKKQKPEDVSHSFERFKMFNKSQRLPILSLPPRVSSGWPTPHITDEDISSYFLPLYAHGWGVTATKGPDLTQRHISTPQLLRKYEFKNFDSMIVFINEIADIARMERHHPHYMKAALKKLTISYQTHSAFRSTSATLTGLTNEPTSPAPAPSITIRDVRSAMLIESIFRRSYLANLRGIENDTVDDRDSRWPKTVADIDEILRNGPID